MITRTWPYGTQKKVKVLFVARLPKKNMVVLLAEEVENPDEGHFLMSTADSWPDAEADQMGVITFTAGGPTGGYWEYTPSEQ